MKNILIVPNKQTVIPNQTMRINETSQTLSRTVYCTVTLLCIVLCSYEAHIDHHRL